MRVSMLGKRFWSASSGFARDRTGAAHNLSMVGPAERLLVRQVLAASARDGAASIPSFLKPEEWGLVVGAAREHGLVPLLYDSLFRREALDSLPPLVAESLRQGSFRTGLANWLAFQELERLARLFELEQIPFALLKGAALAHTVYTDPGLRPMADLDVLVSPSDFPRARALLVQQNYAPSLEAGEGFDWHFVHAQGFTRGNKDPLLIELHWHLFGLPYYRSRVPIEWFWERTMTTCVGKQAVRVLAPEAQLMHLAAHLALHHQHRPLIWSYDLALVLARYREQIQWDQVVQVAGEFELSEVLNSALVFVQAVWEVSIPGDVVTRLGKHGSRRERLLAAIITADRVEARDVWDGLQMPGLKGKLGYFRQVLFPGVEYMRTRYSISDARLVPLYYLTRLCRGAVLFLRSALSMTWNAARVLTGPSTKN